MASGYFEAPTPRVLAHRGLALHAPENTLPAFEAAHAVGADVLETDVRLTKDGAAVLAHDATFRDDDGRVRAIADLELTTLRRIELGGGAGFVALDEALDAFRAMPFNIDVKVDAAVGATAAAVRRTGAIDRVLLASFSDARGRELSRALPGVATSPGRSGVTRALVAAAVGGAGAMRSALAGSRALQAPQRAGRVGLITRRLVRAVHAVGAEIHVWTVNDAAEMRRLFELGVDGVVTDRSDLAVPVARGRI
ncbi:glycerophosphodiester phosphodiesterase family protein [Agromyces aerolatus]|uniref:glycerophosphodiester phosphodiesterase family protein n=1 Tax=Agromyces sp. LY-1074 TaxID=3074080 RepID=UPI00285A7864|nr:MULTISPECIES: glycerophosphodiester phosphodiesterase family protein [unclassified Agromyces]MDR5700098.1 glycerophosphodiester phosphodiesterase family protein [Agromyces sp. LY-1074]MDR5706534.1 glycerophosphodiester phosphodiesterase family protein [Agromyces sp. LY-1358]